MAYDFSDVTKNTSFEKEDVTHNVKLMLSQPNYVYSKKIALEYWSGKTSTMTGGMEVTHTPMLTERMIEFDTDGTTVI